MLLLYRSVWISWIKSNYRQFCCFQKWASLTFGILIIRRINFNGRTEEDSKLTCTLYDKSNTDIEQWYPFLKKTRQRKWVVTHTNDDTCKWWRGVTMAYITFTMKMSVMVKKDRTLDATLRTCVGLPIMVWKISCRYTTCAYATIKIYLFCSIIDAWFPSSIFPWSDVTLHLYTVAVASTVSISDGKKMQKSS